MNSIILLKEDSETVVNRRKIQVFVPLTCHVSDGGEWLYLSDPLGGADPLQGPQGHCLTDLTIPSKIISICYLVLGLELRASCLRGRCSTI
jgi:hypothetical protein